MKHSTENQMPQTLMRRLSSDERGSAMTEFVITLPIFVMIFIGMGMLYKYSNEGLIARMKTNQVLIDDLTADNDIPDFVPAAGAMFSIGSFTDIAVNGAGVLGIYNDSWLKATAAETIIPGQAIPNPANPPEDRIENITLMSGTTAQESWTNMLLNDRATPTWTASGISLGQWAEIITSVASTLGVAPAIAAGIRYSPKQAEEEHTFNHPWTGSMTYNPGRLQLPAPTAATHRLGAVAASRIAMNTVSPYKKCILEFKLGSPCTSAATGSTSEADNLNDLQEQGDACLAQNDVWQSCLDSCGQSGISSDDCIDVCDDEEPPRRCRQMGQDLVGSMGDICDDYPSYCSNPD